MQQFFVTLFLLLFVDLIRFLLFVLENKLLHILILFDYY